MLHSQLLANFLIVAVLGLLMGVAPALHAQDAAALEHAENLPAPFDVWEFAVEGNTALETERISATVYPYLGPARGMAGVEAARAALEKAYQDAGFLTVAVDIPPQKIEGGVVTLKVVEGRVERFRVTGSRYFAQGEIRAAVPSLAEGQVPNFNGLQAELAQVARATPDRVVTPVLRAGTAPGTTVAELQVEDSLPLHGAVELNDKQSPDTTRGRLEARVSFDNLWQKQHKFSLDWSVAPREPTESNVVISSYAFPAFGGEATLGYVHSESDVSSVGDTTVVGRGDTYALRFSRPLRTAPGRWASLLAAIEHRDNTQQTIATTPLTYHRFAGSVNLGWRESTGGQWSSTVGVNAGLRGPSHRMVQNCQGSGIAVEQFECSRFGASAGFAVGTAMVERRQPLPLALTLLVRLDGQVASGPLVSNEQFVAGGVSSVRGYLEGEASGDYGWRSRVEVQSDDLLALAGIEWPAALSLLAFHDAAGVRLMEPLPGQTARFDLAAGGLGLRVAAGRWLSFAADYARVFEAGPRTRNGSNRAHVSVSVGF